MSLPPVRFAASHKFLRKEALTVFPAGSSGLEPREECGLSKFFNLGANAAGLTITHPYRLTCRYSFAKSSMAEAGVLSLSFQDGLCAAWRPVSASCTD